MQIPEAKLDAWVRRYGASSNSYVLLEGPKSYFTLPGVDGFLGYQVGAGVQSKASGHHFEGGKQEFYQDLDCGLSVPQIADKSDNKLKELNAAAR